MIKDTWNPDQYHKFQNERSQPFFDLLDMVDADALPEKVLDLGCGSGELTDALHQRTAARATIGLDSSEKMLEKANALATPGLSFQKGDIQIDIEKLGKFDLIFSNAALQWCSDHPTLFQKIRNALQPHGQIAVQMPMNHDYATHKLAIQMSQEEPWNSLLKGQSYAKQKNMLAPEDYAQMLFKLGFKEQKVLLRVYDHVLGSREDVIEWVKGTLLTYFKSQLSEDDYQKFLTEFRKRLFQTLPDDRPFFYPFKRLLLWGRL